MAVIEYRIAVDENGNATVIQDVRLIGPEDRIIFSKDPNTTKQVAIRYVRSSPFEKEGPQAGEVFLVQSNFGASISEALKVENSTEDKGIERRTPLGKRKVFHFECGEAETGSVTSDGDPQPIRPNGIHFRAWGGGGGDNGGTGGTFTPPPPPG